MSRTGSFPLRVAYDLLARYAEPHSITFDPFCGKGTSLLASRLLGHATYGLDVAPEAVVCSAAKMANIDLGHLLKYIDDLPLTIRSEESVPQAVKTYFHSSTLKEILSV